MELIRLENITKTYHLGTIDVPVLRGISLTIARGEMVALMGMSGSGKTTLMNILGCLDRPTSGRYWLDGQEMSDLTPNQRALMRTAKLGFVFQNFNLLSRTTATQNVLMPLSYAPHHTGGAEARQRAESLLELVGLAERCDHEPSQMSGGQQQRVAVARSLINRPALLLADEPTGNLDSKTSIEILRMFQQLNAEGITVVLVTHDAKVAAYAHRTIHIADGLIDVDETPAPHIRSAWTAVSVARTSHGHRNGNGHGNAVAATAVRERTVVAVGGNGDSAAPLASTAVSGQAKFSPEKAEPKSRRTATASFIPSTLRTALGALRRNKMRSALTGLGVIIGVAAVIAMTEIGQGSRAALERTIASMGANNLLILPGAAMSGSVSFGVGTAQTLKPSDMNEILRQCPAVKDVAPLVWARPQVVYGGRNWIPGNTTGTTPSYLTIREWEVDEGDVFTDHDVHNGNTVCLIGATLKHELFQDESPIGEEIRIRNVSFRVIGVLSRKGANMMGQDQDDILLAPWTAIKFRVNAGGAGSTIGAQSITVSLNSLSNLYPGGTPLYPVPVAAQAADSPQPIRFVNVDMLMAKAASASQIPEAIDQISGLLRERHRLPADRGNDFEIRDLSEITRTIARANRLVSALLLVVAAISLVVGGVGIMNIMLVSVTERTREIGIRMAVGARGYHILQQFLVEAVLLCLAGGAVGIALGRGVSILVRSIEGWTTEVSIPAILVAVLVSVGVGLIFGFYPAWKASRLDPIEALRYE
jgi:macrolide transport system ATP-binding/permease protein